jgi:hypothetical protein
MVPAPGKTVRRPHGIKTMVRFDPASINARVTLMGVELFDLVPERRR